MWKSLPFEDIFPGETLGFQHFFCMFTLDSRVINQQIGNGLRHMRILTNIYGDLINTYGIIYPMGTRFCLYGSPKSSRHRSKDPSPLHAPWAWNMARCSDLTRDFRKRKGSSPEMRFFSSARFWFSGSSQNFNGHQELTQSQGPGLT